ncbi:MAG: MinD/ParA family protein [Alphaproteobacteria bacterium]
MSHVSPTATPSATNVQPMRAQNMTAIASGKGGVGKTTVSVSLAHALARAGRKTLLFDGDLGLANVDVQLGLNPDHDLGSVLNGTLSMAAAATRWEPGGFDIIAGRSGTASMAALPPKMLGEMRLQLLKTSLGYDRVLLDLGAGIDRTVRALTAPAGHILVVTNDEPTSLTDAYAFIKITRQANPNVDMRIIVNMADSKAEGERTYQTLSKVCTNFLHYTPELAGVIRRDPKVRDAVRAQTSLMVRSPNCTAAEDIDKIARTLLVD